MKPIYLLDTGPLVAFLNKNDKFHYWTISELRKVSYPLYTCESVISEACFLLRTIKDGSEAIFKLIERELIVLSFHLDKEVNKVGHLLLKYKNIPISLADACLIRMSEQHSDSIILTLDSDFKIYRKNKNEQLKIIIPQ